MLEQKTRTIEGIEIRTQALPAMRGYRLVPRLVKILGPALGGGAGAVIEAMGSLSADEAEALAIDVLASTQAVHGSRGLIALGSKDGLNIVFSGRILAMLKTLQFVLEVNFSDFLDALSLTPSEAEASPTGDPGTT